MVTEIRKIWSGHARLCARVAIEKGLVCELARVLTISGRLMNIAAFSIRDLREQGRKSYEAITIAELHKICDIG